MQTQEAFADELRERLKGMKIEPSLFAGPGLLIRVPDFVGGYVETVRAVAALGEEAAPRGENTREVLGATIVIEDAAAPVLPVATGRGVSSPLAAAEALQLVGGFSDPQALFTITDHMRAFADFGQFHGAYGPRVGPQMQTVERRLRDDPLTRRAVVTIWDPLRDSIEGVKNYPCTTELQFMVRNERVDLHVTMRANDVWRGLAYDVFMFNQLQRTLANALGRQVGRYFHHATSLHIYEIHWDKVGDLYYPQEDAWDAIKAANPGGIGLPGEGIADAARRAQALGRGERITNATSSERWFAAKYARALGLEQHPAE